MDTAASATIDLSILCADEFLIVADKPSGLLSVPGRGPSKADCMITRVARAYPDALTVHRLDMSTSGLILFARGKAMQRALSALFADSRVEKTYIADVWGLPAAPAGEINLPLLTDWPNRPRQIVDHIAGKPSLTRYETLHDKGGTSRLKLMPVTGRTHQLRVHMAAISHPILGDDLYAHSAARACRPRLALHAAALAFTHPATGCPVRAESPCPF